MILKIRPLLRADVVSESHSGVQIRAICTAWTAARAASQGLNLAYAARGRERDTNAALAALPLNVLAATLGWNPNTTAEFSALLKHVCAPAAGDAGADHGFQMQRQDLGALDIAPSLIMAGSSLDGGKQLVVAPSPLSSWNWVLPCFVPRRRETPPQRP